MEDLAIQQTATGVWPPKNASNPGIFYRQQLEVIKPYFDLFDNVYVGTLLLPQAGTEPWWNNQTWLSEYAQYQKKVAADFTAAFPDVSNVAWYITQEGCL